MSVAIIGGISLYKSRIFSNTKLLKIKTPYGIAEVYKTRKIYIILRHGTKHNIPPHKVNIEANIYALKKLSVKEIIGICSTGSLKKNIKPESIVVPSDYVNIYNVKTFYNNKIKHITPGLSEELRNRIISASKKAKIKIIEKAIYFQSHGPRLETKAEIIFFKNYADIIGMTMANEATLAKEMEIEYASICSVDNFANGITKKELSFEEVQATARKNSVRVLKIINALLG